MPAALATLLPLAQGASDKITAGRRRLFDIGYNEFNTRRQRKWGQQQYEQQRDDNIAFWNMQNEYNSPQNQMKRFQEAGLNPNLIYGQGNSGPASSIQTPDVQSVTYRSPDLQNQQSLLPNITSMYDLELKAAQTDNLRAQNTVIQEDALLRRAQTIQTLTEGERKKLELGLATQLRETNVQVRQEELRKLRTGTDIQIREDARRAALTSQSLKESAERLKQMPLTRAETKARIENLQRSGVLQEIDIKLRKNGINPNDPAWQRIIGKVLTDLIEDPNSSDSFLTKGLKWLLK